MIIIHELFNLYQTTLFLTSPESTNKYTHYKHQHIILYQGCTPVFPVVFEPLYTCLLPFLGLMLSLLSMGRDSLDRTSSAPWEAAVPRSRAVSSPDMASMASSWALFDSSIMSFSWASCLAYIDTWWHQKHSKLRIHRQTSLEYVGWNETLWPLYTMKESSIIMHEELWHDTSDIWLNILPVVL